MTFDDAEGNSNPNKSLEMRVADPDQFWYMNFDNAGNAGRTNISGGKYGRGAQFDGDVDSRIAITRLNRPGEPNHPPEDDTNGNFRFMLWVKPNAVGPGVRQEIFRATGSFAIELVDRKIVIRDEEDIPHVVHTTNLSLSSSTFHHLWVEYADQTVKVHVDFGSPVEVPFGPMAPWDLDVTAGSMGSRFSGVLDELLVTIFSAVEVPEPDLRFDRDPTNCPFSGLTCAEDRLNVFPPNWPPPPLPALEVPVRYKAVWDALTCTTETKCPLLFLISGGGACADDYSPLYEVEAYAQRGFLVVAIDPACDKGYPWLHWPHETSQLIAAKTDAFANPLFSDLILGTHYYATGCSHGAQSVASWLLSEGDHPRRVFGRSANYAGHCTYHMAPFVGNWTKMDQVSCGFSNYPSPHVHNDSFPQEQCIEDQLGVNARNPAWLVRQQRLDGLPLKLCQVITSMGHAKLLCGA